MSHNAESIVTIQALEYTRRDNPIFRGVDLAIPRGKVTAIMGPSGTGKTTLLRLIGGQIVADRGLVEVNGQNVANLSRSGLNKMRRKMGMLFQEGALFTDFNVFENVAFLLREHTNLPNDMIRDLVLLKLEAVGLRGAAFLKPSELSGGMSRRVALARAIMLDPELMLYDEPFTGQDPINKGVLMKLIRELNDAFGLTSVIVSHDVQEMLAISDYLYVLANGKILGHGVPQQVINDSNPELKQFVNGLPDGPVPFRYPAVPLEQQLESL